MYFMASALDVTYIGNSRFNVKHSSVVLADLMHGQLSI